MTDRLRHLAPSLLLLLVGLLFAAPSVGRQPAQLRTDYVFQPIPIEPKTASQLQFRGSTEPKVIIDDGFIKKPLNTARSNAKAPDPARKAVVSAQKPVVPRSTDKPVPSSKHRISGKASWYCRAGVSVCHHSYPDRAGVTDLYAAACLKLRRAMGSSWRGDRVTVSGNGRTIRVRLIDWCGSTDKTIDLYWDAMRALGGTGVLRVVVSW